MKKLQLLRCSSLLLVCSSLFTFCNAQYTVLHNFRNVDGSEPQNGVIDSAGILYGMTYTGGANMDGCIYSYNTGSNTYTDLHDFNLINGANPYGSLLLSGTTLYGMASSGGAHGVGLFSPLIPVAMYIPTCSISIS